MDAVPSSPAKPSDVVKRAFKAFRARDVKTLAEISAPEIEITSVTGILAGREKPYRGVGALADYLRDVDTIWDEIDLVPEEYHELGEERVLVFGRVRASRGGASLDTPNAWLWQLRGGKVLSVQVYAEPSTSASWLFNRRR